MRYFIVLRTAIFSFFITYANAVDIKILFKSGESVLYPIDNPKVLLFTQEHMPIFAYIKNHYDEFSTAQPVDLSKEISKPVFDCIVGLTGQFLALKKEVREKDIRKFKDFLRNECAGISKIDILNAVDYLGEATNDTYKKFLELIITLCYDEFKSATKIDISTINSYLQVKLAGLFLNDVLNNIKVSDSNGPPTSDITLPDVSEDAYLKISRDMSEDGVVVSCFDKSSVVTNYYIDLKKKSFKTVPYTYDDTLNIDSVAKHAILQQGVSSDGHYVYSLSRSDAHYFFYMYDLRQAKGITKKVDILLAHNKAYIFYDVVRQKFMGIFYGEESPDLKVTFVIFDPTSPSADDMISTHNILNRLKLHFYYNDPLLLDNIIVRGMMMEGYQEKERPIVFDLSSQALYFGDYDSSKNVYFYEKEGKKVVLDVVLEFGQFYRLSFIPHYQLAIQNRFPKCGSAHDTNSAVCNSDYFKFFKEKKVEKTARSNSFFQRLKQRVLNQKSHEMHLLVYDLLPERFVKALRYMQHQYHTLHEQYTNILHDAWYLYHAGLNTAMFQNNITNNLLYKNVSPEIKAFYNTEQSVPTPELNNKSYWYALQQLILKLKR